MRIVHDLEQKIILNSNNMNTLINNWKMGSNKLQLNTLNISTKNEAECFGQIRESLTFS